MNICRNILVSRYQIRGILILFMLIIPTVLSVRAQTDSTGIADKTGSQPKSEINLFGSKEILNVDIIMDLPAFLKKTTPNDSFDAEIIFNAGTADSIRKKIRIRYRGILRKELCSFPPIEVIFKKPFFADSAKIKNLKLVTHCRSGTISDEYVLREYLVYKLFNALTDTSFRVRLLRVNYIDATGKKKAVVKYGIFIEPINILAKRLDCTIVKSATLTMADLVPQSIDRLAIFNYMVSNWDWSIPAQHNVKVLKPIQSESGALNLVVPYDFDLTGVVNADYAIPPPNVPIENVRQRLFWGICRSREVYRKDLMEYSEHKADIYREFLDCPYASKVTKRDIKTFLDEFFDQLEKPRNLDYLIDDFLKTCKR